MYHTKTGIYLKYARMVQHLKFSKLGVVGNFNLMKNIYKTCIASIILTNEKLNTFLLRSGTSQGHPLYHYFQQSTSSSSKYSQTRNGNKTGEDVIEKPLFTDYMIFCRKSQRVNI